MFFLFSIDPSYTAVIDGGVPVYMVIKEHVVPLTTLRDLVDDRVTIDCKK